MLVTLLAWMLWGERPRLAFVAAIAFARQVRAGSPAV
jgi:hypothetical protein